MVSTRKKKEFIARMVTCLFQKALFQTDAGAW